MAMDAPAILRWDIAEGVLKAGFLPDTFSTDWTPEGLAQVVDFPTVNASRTFSVFRNRGTLKVGATADIAVLELREGTFKFVDNFGSNRDGHQRLFPVAAVLAGKRVSTRG